MSIHTKARITGFWRAATDASVGGRASAVLEHGEVGEQALAEPIGSPTAPAELPSEATTAPEVRGTALYGAARLDSSSFCARVTAPRTSGVVLPAGFAFRLTLTRGADAPPADVAVSDWMDLVVTDRTSTGEPAAGPAGRLRPDRQRRDVDLRRGDHRAPRAGQGPHDEVRRVAAGPRLDGHLRRARRRPGSPPRRARPTRSERPVDSPGVGRRSRSVPLTRVPGCPSLPRPPATTPVRDVLAAAVAALGGEQRDGQIAMAEAVAAAFAGGQHLLVQAGTGTGKSLGYLVPALLHDERVVVATATLALQHQLVERDIPRLVEAVGELPGVDATYAVLKGRSNYACLHRIREGVPDDQGVLVEVPTGSQGAEVLKLRAWAEEEAEDGRHRRARQRAAAHRPGLAPGQRQPPRVPGRDQVPVRPGVLRRAGAREGAALAPDRHQPLAAGDRRGRGGADDPRLRRGRRRRGPRGRLPGHPGGHRRADGARRRAGRPALPAARGRERRRRPARRGRRRAGRRGGRGHRRAASTRCPTSWPRRSRWSATPRARCLSAYPEGRPTAPTPGCTQARGMVQDVFVNAERMAADADSDVLWLAEAGRPVAGPAARRAAPGVGPDARQAALRQDRGLHLRHPDARRRLHAVATSVGLKPAERVERRRPRRSSAASPTTSCRGAGSTSGSPFDYGKQAILYVAAHLPPPGRDGLGERQLDEIVELVDAARGPHAGAVLLAPRRRAGRRGGPRAAART